MSSTRSLLCPLVGAFHRPPAKTVLEVLPIGTTLLLVPEPENPYDAGAIRVLVDLDCLEGDGMDMTDMLAALDAAGADGRDVIDGPPLQLGYCAASSGKPLAKLEALWSQTGLSPVGNASVLELFSQGEVAASLTFGPDGHPAVHVTVSENE